MSITTVFKDREPTYPNRYKVTPVSGGSAYDVVLTRADEPGEPGTALNADTFNGLIKEIKDTLVPQPSTASVGKFLRVKEVTDGVVTGTDVADAGIPLPSSAKAGQYIKVTGVDDNGNVTSTATADAVEKLPVEVDDEGYTDITGLRYPTAMDVVRSGSEITVTTTFQGGVESVTVIALDDNDYPVTVTTDGVACAVSWEGFEDG